MRRVNPVNPGVSGLKSRNTNTIYGLVIICLMVCALCAPVMAYWYEPGPPIVARAYASIDWWTWTQSMCVTVGQTVCFTGEYSYDLDIKHDPQLIYDTVAPYIWDFGDGEVSSFDDLIEPWLGWIEHSYETPGVYLARVEAFNTSSCAHDPPAWSDDDHSVTVYVLPSSITVTDDGDFTASTTQLSATWTDCGDLTYEYAIGTTSGGTDVQGWTACSTPYVIATGLTLQNGETYYFSVRAKGMAGCVSEPGVSDGIMVSYGPPLPNSVIYCTQ